MKYNYIFQKCLCISLVFILFFSTESCAQSFSPKNVSQKLISKYYSPSYSTNYYRTNTFFSVSANLLKGNDHTDIIQKIVNDNSNILLPNTTIFINSKGLKIGSNKKIIFQKNTKIKYLGPANGKYSDIVKIYDAHNVEIINPVVIGSRNNHIEQSGQWSAGISVLNSVNVKIINPRISEAYGDGIFIGSEDGGYSEKVLVSGGWINDSRRNGVSITSGRNVLVQNILISNTYGHDPEAGVDIEASWNKDRLEDINLKNICTFNNSSAGIMINLNGLAVDNPKDAKISSITIDGHTDIGSRHGFLTSLNTIDNQFDTTGTILVKNVNWKSTRGISYWRSSQDHRIKITFSKIMIDDIEKRKDFENDIKKAKNIKLLQSP